MLTTTVGCTAAATTASSPTASATSTALLFPPLYVLARTRHYPAVRTAGAAVALAAATGWVVERLAGLPNRSRRWRRPPSATPGWWRPVSRPSPGPPG